MSGQEKHLEDCSVSKSQIPVGIKRKSLAPLVFFGTTGTMLDIIMGITACEREHAERQMQLLEAQNFEAQNFAADASLAETGEDS
ncbi:hypothetical protein ACB092_12G155400 [Castanea dentata]